MGAVKKANPDAMPATTSVRTAVTTGARRMWAHVDQPLVFGFLFAIGALVAVGLAIAFLNLNTVIMYIVLALFLALGINPVVRFLEGHGLKRGIAVPIVIVALVAILAGVFWLLIPPVVNQLSAFAASVPGMVQDFMNGPIYADLIARFGDSINEALAAAQAFLSDPSNILNIFGGVFQVAGALAGGLTGLIMVTILTMYFVAGLPAMKDGLLRLAPAYRRRTISDIADQIIEAVGSFVQGQVVLSLINAAVMLVTYLVLGLPFALLLAVAAFFLALIPMLGSWLALALGAVVALFFSPQKALIFIIVYLIYMQIEAYVLAPKILGKAVAVPGSLIVIGALVGGTLMGLTGALLAVPVTASLLIIIYQIWIPKQDVQTVDPDIIASKV